MGRGGRKAKNIADNVNTICETRNNCLKDRMCVAAFDCIPEVVQTLPDDVILVDELGTGILLGLQPETQAKVLCPQSYGVVWRCAASPYFAFIPYVHDGDVGPGAPLWPCQEG